jgi:hypothetical protein
MMEMDGLFHDGNGGKWFMSLGLPHDVFFLVVGFGFV